VPQHALHSPIDAGGQGGSATDGTDGIVDFVRSLACGSSAAVVVLGGSGAGPSMGPPTGPSIRWANEQASGRLGASPAGGADGPGQSENDIVASLACLGLEPHAAALVLDGLERGAPVAGVCDASARAPGQAGAADATGCGPGRVRWTLTPAPGGGGLSVLIVRELDEAAAIGRSSEHLPQPATVLVTALDALSAEVAILDEGGRIVAVNRAWRDFAQSNGFSDNSFGVGTNYLAICDAATGPASFEAHAVADGLRAVLGGRQTTSYVEYPCDSPNEQRWYQVRASAFECGGRRFAVVSHESLTESKQAEQRYREQLDEMAHNWRLSSLGELASGLAHELNQPLGAISNYMNGCLRRLEHDTISREKLVEALRECAQLADYAGGIIKRMRGFASHSTSAYHLMDLSSSVCKAIELARTSPETRRVRFCYDLCKELPPVRGDEVQLQQVALNLIRNAADAVLESGRSDGQVRVRTHADKDGMVCLEVADTGDGLPDGMESRLFEPFFSTKSRGMGLGLSISKTIAEVHGGRLLARNHEDGGAVFELCLPAVHGSAGTRRGCRSRQDADHNQASTSQGGCQ